MLVRFGKYWRISPFVFSFVPRSQEWCGEILRKANSTSVS
jgi:hypothetical protein